MGATACVKEGIDLRQINHKPTGMGGLDTGLLRKSRFVPTSSNVTKSLLSSFDMDATIWVGKKKIRFIESFCLLRFYSYAFFPVSLVGISLAAHEGFLFLND